MQKIIVFSFICTIVLPAFSQNTWIVSNNPTSIADFDTIQHAIDAASAGDIIYVEGTTINYQAFEVNKKVHIVGSGYWKLENMIMDVNPQSAKVADTVRFVTGSDSSIIEGMELQGSMEIDASNIVVRSNKILQSVWLQNIPVNIFLYDDWIQAGLYGSALNTVVSNCILYGTAVSPQIWESNGNNENCRVLNSVLNGGGYPFSCLRAMSNCEVTNSIFTPTTCFQLSNCAISHNIFSATAITFNGIITDSLGNGNIMGVPLDSMFNLSNPSPDGKFQLIGDSTSNAALGAGINGEDCGAFGGDTPYRLSGIVGIPSIYLMHVPVAGDTSNLLNVKIKAKSN